MPCYVMLCYVMLCYVMLCYVMLTTLCYGCIFMSSLFENRYIILLKLLLSIFLICVNKHIIINYYYLYFVHETVQHNMHIIQGIKKIIKLIPAQVVEYRCFFTLHVFHKALFV